MDINYYLNYFKNTKNSFGRLAEEEVIYDPVVLSFISEFTSTLYNKDYGKVIGDFCYDEEGWFCLDEVFYLIDGMNKDELIAILSGLITESEAIIGLFLDSCKNSFTYRILKELKKYY